MEALIATTLGLAAVDKGIRAKGVGLDVGTEVVAAGKVTSTRGADIGATACVLAQVAGEFVAAGKRPLASRPGACKRTLACVHAQMGLEV